ncbi:MAG: threonine--tRNA ligase [Pseudobdellovibrionaceae bacterium]
MHLKGILMSYQFDHRQLADEMEIFFFDEEIGAGLPVWLPNGVAIRDQLEIFVKELERQGGYQRVVSPHLGRQDLYEKSGHLSCFSENMYPPIDWQKEGDEDKKSFYLKPMNCPHHHKVFSALPRSYRHLPLRIAEYGQVYRFEPSGSLRGLSRVRGLCQNDAHIYVDPVDSLKEVLCVLDLHEECYKKLGLKGYRYRLSLRDPSRPNDFQGEDCKWIEAESILRKALLERGLEFFEDAGEAAFYGPKIDVQMKMGSGQEESIASVQLDFLSAERFGLAYSARSGEQVRPWIIHRAPLGSHERFVALLLEYFDGQLPGWLSPIQVMLLPLSDRESDACRKIHKALMKAGIRVKVDESQGSLSKRVLFAHKYRPFAKLIVGPKEISSGILKLEFRDGKKEGDINSIIDILKESCSVP